ncbi:MAG: GNAT family N-acetyltransferase [Gemmatimonadota bacterium]|nr:GNAT family N-acetyltransferase [Gemmatimonadota bacterium]
MTPTRMHTGELVVSLLQTGDDARACARLMATSEPWITLGRSYETSLNIIQDPSREVYLVRRGVHPDGLHRSGPTGAGLGSKLVEFAEQRILQVSPNIFLCVSSFNQGARRLYEQLGYTVVGELTDYIVRGHSELLLRKTTGPLTGFSAKVPRG